MLPSLRIVGGESARVMAGPRHPYPFYAQLFSRNATSRWNFVCGGAVIEAFEGTPSGERWSSVAPSALAAPAGPCFWILTAAHCLDPSVAYGVNVFWDASALPAPGSELPAPSSLPAASDAQIYGANASHMRFFSRGLTIYAHPHRALGGVNSVLEMLGIYPAQAPRDIALIRVALPAGEVLPAWMVGPGTRALPVLGAAAREGAAAAAPSGAEMVIIGHGQTSNASAAAAPTLQQLAVAPAASSARPSFPASLIHDPMHAVVSADADRAASLSGACFGDSGGPLLRRASLSSERRGREGAGVGEATPSAAPGAWHVLGPLCCSLSATCGDRSAADLYADLDRYLQGDSEGAKELRADFPETWGRGVRELMRTHSPPVASLGAIPAADNVWDVIPRAPIQGLAVARIVAIAVGIGAAALLVNRLAAKRAKARR